VVITDYAAQFDEDIHCWMCAECGGHATPFGSPGVIKVVDTTKRHFKTGDTRWCSQQLQCYECCVAMEKNMPLEYADEIADSIDEFGPSTDGICILTL
tara:strand:+ start:92 stop:385 length:294 start_codon:yes stop_codon:yes gene_type:complete